MLCTALSAARSDAATTNQYLAIRLAELELESKTEGLELTHDAFSRNTRNQLKQVFDAIRELMTPPDPPKRFIGFGLSPLSHDLLSGHRFH
jgi:hypothetical protein